MISGTIAKGPNNTIFVYKVPHLYDNDNVLNNLVYDTTRGIHYLNGSGYRDTDIHPASDADIVEFNNALDKAGLIYGFNHYHSKPSPADRFLMKCALHTHFTQWPELLEIVKECDGTYAKEFITELCIQYNHKEEAHAGML